MRNIVFVGAGGTGMSGLVGMFFDLGLRNLVCIDSSQSQLTDKLVKKGINVIIGHGKYDITKDDAVIYSEATVDSIEVKTAKSFSFLDKKMVFVMNYFEFLGELSKYFKTIGIAGTNGKSSTSSLAIFTANNFLDNFGIGILGALVPDFDNNSYLINFKIKSDLQNIFESIFSQKAILNYDLLKKYYFFVESCEYKRHFLNLDLDYVIVTNVNLDHTDYFKDELDYQNAFLELLSNVKKNILLNDEFGFINLFKKFKDKIVKVKTRKIGFDYLFGEVWDWNGSFVLKLMQLLGVNDSDSILKKMSKFKGLWRRMEFLGKNKKGADVFSDYGHIAESILFGYNSLNERFPNKKIIVVFQPHQMRRILVGWNDFVDVLQKYDDVFIYDIYAARENIDDIKLEIKEYNLDLGEINSVFDLGNVFANAVGGEYIDNKNSVLEKINSFGSDSVVVYFSAGDLDYLIRNIL